MRAHHGRPFVSRSCKCDLTFATRSKKIVWTSGTILIVVLVWFKSDWQMYGGGWKTLIVGIALSKEGGYDKVGERVK